MKHSEICRKAAAIIRTGGLCKGSYTNRYGEHCAIGSVIRAVGLDPNHVAALSGKDSVVADNQDERVLASWANDVLDHLRDKADDLRGKIANRSVAVWNDQPIRTAEDVAQFLESAAVDFEGFEAEAPCDV